MSATPFYKPRPIPPDENKQMIRLRWALRASVIGWIIYGAFAYAFADIAIIPPAVQSWSVLIGSILIVAGAESNTIATTEAALSKLGTDRFSGWDVSAFAASLLGGICTPLITFSTRQPELADAWWRTVAVQHGPLILGIAGVLDFYGAIAELSLARRDYNADMAVWIEENQAYNQAHGLEPSEPLPKAGIDDFWRVVGRLNGRRDSLDAELLEDELAKDELGLPSPSSVARWLKLAQRGD
jgi:hypothetical protein